MKRNGIIFQLLLASLIAILPGTLHSQTSEFKISEDLHSQIPEFIISDNFHYQNLSSTFEYAEDPSGTLGIDEVESSQGIWKQATPIAINLSYTKSTYWIRLKINNRTSLPFNLVLDANFPMLSRVDLFIPEVNLHQTIDRNNPPDIEDRWETFPFFFQVQPNHEYDVYARVESKMDMVIDFDIYEERYFHRHLHGKYLLNGMFYGIMCIMIFYNFFLFMYLGNRVYLAYVFYSIGFLMYLLSYFGMGYRFVWGDWIWLQERATPFWMSIGFGIFAPEFLIHFLSSEENSRDSVKKIFRGIQFSAIILLIYVIISDPNDSIRLFPIGSLVLLIVILAIIVVRIRDGYIPAWFVLMGFLPLMGFGVIASLRAMGSIPSNMLTLYGMLYGSAFDLVILSLGLAYRIKILKRNESRAKLANSAKTEFIAQMSHEIRTPLQGLETSIDLLVKEDNLTELEKLKKVIYKSLRSLTAILNDILDFSKIESGYFTIHKEETDIEILVAEIQTFHRAKIQNKGLKFIVENPRERFNPILTDGMRLQQVLNNLLSNSTKFTESGKISLRYALNSSGDNRHIYFEIEDTGIGIKKESIPRLFQNFSQADNSISSQFGGTGLGLAICKKIIELLDGKIGVESEFGKGSKFWFTIPYVTIDKKPQEFEVFSEKEISNLNLLILEDSQELQMLIKRTFTKLGYNVHVVDGLEPAIQLLKKNHYDFVVSDFYIKGGTALELTRNILNGITNDSLSRESSPVVFVLTGEKDLNIHDKCISAGVKEVFLKPIDFEKIHKKIQSSFNDR